MPVFLLIIHLFSLVILQNSAQMRTISSEGLSFFPDILAFFLEKLTFYEKHLVILVVNGLKIEPFDKVLPVKAENYEVYACFYPAYGFFFVPYEDFCTVIRTAISNKAVLLENKA